MKRDVTVCIPSIPPRCLTTLARALGSVYRQTCPAAATAVALDTEHDGAWTTRQRALDMATSTWVAFLDDDDEFLAHHLQRCLEVAEETGVDVVVPWFDVVGGSDPLGHRNLQIDPEHLHQFGITCLIRREAIGNVRFLSRTETGEPEDWRFWNDLARAGASFHQIPETTWLWHHNGRNTSGRPDRW